MSFPSGCRTTSWRAIAAILGVLALGAITAVPASAQDEFCLITGITTSCKPVQWCGPGPSELYSYHWEGPNGFVFDGPCFDATVTGTYTLTVTRLSDGRVETCSKTFTFTPGDVPCGITGPSTVCKGQTVELCGPVGDLGYHWEGPGGFTASTRCVTVGAAGTYTLVTSSPSSRCEALCTHDLAFGDCPPPPGENCPRTVGFWSAQCAQKDNGSTKFNKSQMEAIASCVDDHSALFDWTDAGNPLIDFDLFCRNMNPSKPMDQRKQARRQFAGLLANVCTGDLGLITNNGEEVSLDLDTPVVCNGVHTTIGDLIHDADAALVDLQDDDLTKDATKTAYGNLITCLDNINNGIGIGAVCPGGDAPILRNQSTLAGIAQGSVELYRPWPNPTRGAMQMSFAIARSGDDAQLGVYDLAGRLQKTLVSGPLAAGVHTVGWDGSGTDGAQVHAGVYFIRGRVSGNRIASQIIVVR